VKLELPAGNVGQRGRHELQNAGDHDKAMGVIATGPESSTRASQRLL
jgi:hypothetical protein